MNRTVSTMLKRVSTAGALLLVIGFAAAGETPLPAMSASAVIARMSRSHEEIKTLCGTFRELHRLELLERPILTHGRFWGDSVKRAIRKDIVSGDTGQDPPRPARELVEKDRLGRLPLLKQEALGAVAVATMKQAQVYYPAEKRLEIYHLDPQEMEHVFFLNLLLKPAAIMEGYTASVTQAPIPPWPGTNAASKVYYALTLKPKKKEVRRAVSAVTLYVDPKDFFPRAIEQHDPVGDQTLLIMEEIRIDGTIPPDAFRIHPAPGTKRTELRVGSFLK